MRTGGASDERGMSPVVGVALLIGITVMLAVATAGFLLGFADSTNEPGLAGLDIDHGDSITVVSEGYNVDAVEVRDDQESTRDSTASVSRSTSRN